VGIEEKKTGAGAFLTTPHPVGLRHEHHAIHSHAIVRFVARLLTLSRIRIHHYSHPLQIYRIPTPNGSENSVFGNSLVAAALDDGPKDVSGSCPVGLVDDADELRMGSAIVGSL